MSTREDENGVKCVIAVSPNSKAMNVKRVFIRDFPASAVGRIIKCKRISAMQPEQKHTSKINNDVELTVVPSSEKTMVVGSTLHNSERSSTPVATTSTPTTVTAAGSVTSSGQKRIKTETVTGKESLHVSQNSLKLLENETVPIAESEYEEVIEEDSDHNLEEEDYGHIYSVRRRGYAPSNEDEYISPGIYKAKRTPQSTEKRKVKPKLFRSEWLDIDIFRDWLDRDPTSPYKARCVACDSVMNAGKSELEKHAAGAKHTKAVERMQQEMLLNQMVAADGGEDSNEEEKHLAEETEEYVTTDPIMLGKDISPDLQLREQQVEALNRVATAIECLSSTASEMLEKMASYQESLGLILQQMHNK